MRPASVPSFHLYGDPPDDQAFDFVHIETLSSRSAPNRWTIQAHHHRNLFQIFVIERGGGEMTLEIETLSFKTPTVILVPPTVVHGFRFLPEVTEGWVVTFTEDVAAPVSEHSAALDHLKGLASHPVLPLANEHDLQPLLALCRRLQEECLLLREGHRIALRSYVTLIAVELGRLAADRAHNRSVTPVTADPTVKALNRLIDQHFQRERKITFYAKKLAVTPDRLNDHVKRATGATAGRLIRQRVLTEAKRQLVYTASSINEISLALAFSDSSHFVRFFRKQTGATPQAFRAHAHSNEIGVVAPMGKADQPD